MFRPFISYDKHAQMDISLDVLCYSCFNLSVGDGPLVPVGCFGPLGELTLYEGTPSEVLIGQTRPRLSLNLERLMTAWKF